MFEGLAGLRPSAETWTCEAVTAKIFLTFEI